MHTHAFMLSCLTTATFVGLLCSSAPCHAQDPDREGRGQVERGFVLRASLGGRASVLSSLGSSSSLLGLGSNSALQIGVFAGGKIGRVMLGVGLDFSNLTVPSSGSSTSSLTSLIVAPEVMGVVARTADQRVEMLLDAALGLGGLIQSSGSSNTLQLSYQLGPGVRYWAHRHFAVQGLTGFSGQVYFPSGSSNASPTSLHGVFAALSVLGVL